MIDAWRAGREAWPEILISAEQFEAFARSCDPRALIRFPTDLYLAAACEQGDPSALEVFEREVLARVRRSISAIDGRSDFVDEVFQQLRTKLFVGDGSRRQIADYAGRGPLRAWIRRSAARIALMLQRSQRRRRETPIDDWADLLATMTPCNPELDLLEEQYASAFSSALRVAAERLEPRLFAVLRMSFVDDLSIDEIGAVYAVNRATAARWIQRACTTLYRETRTIVAERFVLTSTEFDRMTQLTQGRLSFSLSQLLPGTLQR